MKSHTFPLHCECFKVLFCQTMAKCVFVVLVLPTNLRHLFLLKAVTILECLIQSRRIGDIRWSDEPGWRAVGQDESVSRCEDRTSDFTRRLFSSLLVGDPRHSTGKYSYWEFPIIWNVLMLTGIVCTEDYWFLSTVRMARDMSDKEILKMELEQLKKEVNTPRTAVCLLMKKFNYIPPFTVYCISNAPNLICDLFSRWVQTAQTQSPLWRRCFPTTHSSRESLMTKTPTKGTRAVV